MVLVEIVGTLSVLARLAGCVPAEPVGVAPEPPELATAPDPLTYHGGFNEYFRGEPGASLRFIDYPATRTGSDRTWGAVLTDIHNHLPPRYGDMYWDSDKITAGHETTHGINSDIRNYHNDTGRRANGFYALEGRGVIVEEPNIRKSAVAAYVPASLRGSRYELYIVGQTAWDDTPLYVFDEWIAYVNGGAVGVDRVDAGLWREGWRDGVAGQLEFNVYALALAMAVEARDPAYFRSNEQFREFLAWNLQRSFAIYRHGKTMEDFRWDTQERYEEALRTSPDANAMREFAKRIFGEAWANEVVLGMRVDPPPMPPVPPSTGDAGPTPTRDAGGGTMPPMPLPPPSGDSDGDGIRDADDLCSDSPVEDRVWSTGEWRGCAAGQMRDRDRGPDLGGSDSDGDGIADWTDLCSRTPAGRRVWTFGEWIGCAGGERRDGRITYSE